MSSCSCNGWGGCWCTGTGLPAILVPVFIVIVPLSWSWLSCPHHHTPSLFIIVVLPPFSSSLSSPNLPWSLLFYSLFSSLFLLFHCCSPCCCSPHCSMSVLIVLSLFCHCSPHHAVIVLLVMPSLFSLLCCHCSPHHSIIILLSPGLGFVILSSLSAKDNDIGNKQLTMSLGPFFWLSLIISLFPTGPVNVLKHLPSRCCIIPDCQAPGAVVVVNRKCDLQKETKKKNLWVIEKEVKVPSKYLPIELHAHKMGSLTLFDDS